jgi:molecular chaperone GrpE
MVNGEEEKKENFVEGENKNSAVTETLVNEETIDDLKKQLEEKENQIKEDKNRFLRLAADFDNYKKRVKAEKEEFTKFSNEILITALLPMLDNMDRAVAAMESNSSNLEEIGKGVALIHRQFEDVLIKAGLKKIEALENIFNPVYHEAVMQKKVDGKPEGKIVEELQKGYMLHGKVIRPAMVVVAK